MHGCRCGHVVGVRVAEVRTVANGGTRRIHKYGLGRGAAARERGGDSFALEGVHEPGGVSEEEHPAARGVRTDHAELEPATEWRGVRGSVGEFDVAEVSRSEERRVGKECRSRGEPGL